MKIGKQNSKKSAMTSFHKRLHRWYHMHGRQDLPWRNTTSAYEIYLSEIMLQQTQVKTVLERFYTPFLKHFPTLESLANADEAAVLKTWEGLGYYTRARNLHRAAKLAAPVLPKAVEDLEALPGIGKNTAHAIAAFAYHHPVPVMEANVKRVLCRIFALKNPSTEQLWEHAHNLLDVKRPFNYNQAMMDIGAMVCTKAKPHCSECPANDFCIGQKNPSAYPAPKQKKTTPVRHRVLVVFEDAAGNVWLEKRESKFLGGLYGFPEYAEDISALYHQNIHYNLAVNGKMLGNVTHTYSHFKLIAQAWKVKVKYKGGEGWYSQAAIRRMALAGVDHKVIALL